jgi:hypothetical protein
MPPHDNALDFRHQSLKYRKLRFEKFLIDDAKSKPIRGVAEFPDKDIKPRHFFEQPSKWPNAWIYKYSTKVTFRHHDPEECRLHMPLLRACFCTTVYAELNKLDSPWDHKQDIVLPSGQSSFELVTENKNALCAEDKFKGNDCIDSGRWALVFGVPDGENPDKYIVGTVLTKPVRWIKDKDCKITKK